MRGVDKGASDIHHGNKVAMVPGHVYEVSVTLRGEHAAVKVAAPE